MSHTSPAAERELIGRRTEVFLVRRAMAASSVTTIVGSIGVGKTTVAVEASRAASRNDRSRVHRIFVGGLAPQTAITDVVDDRVARERAEGVLRGTVLLDRCEDRSEEALDAARRLTVESDQVRVLLTSTVATPDTGHALVPLRPFARIPAGVGGADLMSHDAVRLFIACAREADPYFELHPSDGDTVVTICNACGGNPLMIATAAAHVRSLALDQIADMPADVLATLHPAREADFASRVGRTRARLQHASRELLGAARDLGGEATPEALAQLTDARSRLLLPTAVTELVDHSLLIQRRDGDTVTLEASAAVSAAGPARPSGTSDPAGGREIVEYLSRLTRTAEREWMGPKLRHWQCRLASELPLIERCVTALAGDESGRRLARGIVLPLRLFWTFTNRHATALRLLRMCVARDDEMDAGRAATHAQIAYSLLCLEHVDAAERELQTARRIRESAGATRPDPYLLMFSGLAAIRSNRPDDAHALLEPVARQLSGPGYPPGHGLEALFYSAFLAASAGRPDRAVLAVAAAHELCTQLDSEWARGLIGVLQGLVLIDEGDWRRAAATLEESLRVLTALGDQVSISLALELLSRVEASHGDYLRATQFLAPAFDGSIVSRRVFSGWSHATEQALRSALGTQRFRSVLREASRKPLDLVVSIAIGRVPQRSDSLSEPVVDLTLDLTSRERDVARLVARGYSNPRIASSLVISRRTAEGHVQRILRKGGFATRTEIGVWYSLSHGARSEAS